MTVAQTDYLSVDQAGYIVSQLHHYGSQIRIQEMKSKTLRWGTVQN